MNKQLLENNYLIIDNFILPQQALSLYQSFKEYSKKEPNKFNYDEQCPKSLACYDYMYFVEMLVDKITYMTYLMEEPMLPTYSYARLYSYGETLEKHTDRPACEVSVTLNLGGDKDWEIFFTKPDGQEVSVILKPSQAVVYLGCKSIHWREKFEGTEYAQVFLHYVRAKGENAIYYFDKKKN